MSRRQTRGAFIGAAAGFALAPAAGLAANDGALLALARGFPGVSGVVATTMGRGAPLLSHNPNERFPSASVIKLIVMLTAFAREATSPGTLSDRVVFHRANLIGGSDFLASQPDGATFSVLQLIRPMIQLSDNTAANALIGHFGLATINRVGRAAGLHRTRLARHFLDFAAIVHHEDNVTTAADMAHLVFELERGAREDVATVASPRACRAMIQIMLGQTDREGIPAGIPHGIAVANKTGAVTGTRNDIAIVDPMGNSPFVLAIVTKDIDDYGAAYLQMRRIARAVYRRVAGTDL
ncbi:MAG TPA: serine hydrolase [Candidatus Baltobacteraceae bacterium]